MSRSCSRPGCNARAVVQLTYAYQSLRVEVRPLVDEPDPGSHHLCQAHLDRLSLPKGWRLIRRGKPGATRLSEREIAALATEIRRVGGLGEANPEAEGTEHSLSSRTNLVTLTSRAHLRVVADVSRYSPG